MGSRFFMYVSLAADLGIIITKFIAAVATGSAAMISEGIHSIIDLVNQLLLLIGIKKSEKKPDSRRPFGYGREVYFWSFVVSLLLFSVGGCVSFYQGILHFRRPISPGEVTWNYIVLSAAFIFTSISMLVTLKKFNNQRASLPFWTAVKKSKDPVVFITLLGDFGDMAGLIIAFFGIYLTHLLHNPYYDAIASMTIGILMIIISLLLVRESRSLLMGEAAGNETLRAVVKLAQADNAIVKVKRHFSQYMSPEEVILQLSVIFKKGLTTEEITGAVKRIKESIQEKFPHIKQIFIEPGV
jgi:cation diffusion facilitator family transporter